VVLVLCIVVVQADSGDADLLVVEADRLGRQAVLNSLDSFDFGRIPDVEPEPELVQRSVVVDLRALPRWPRGPRWARHRCCRPWLRERCGKAERGGQQAQVIQ
jgi:hypothetical protein